MDTKAVNQKDFIRWGIEGSIKREIIIDRLIDEQNEAEEAEEAEEELIQLYLRNNNINTQEELAKWMLKENLDKSSLLARAQRHAKWVKICEKKYKKSSCYNFFKK